MGAKVAVDFSSAINANFKNHKKFIDNGSLICVRGDVFDLPILDESVDIVFVMALFSILEIMQNVLIN